MTGIASFLTGGGLQAIGYAVAGLALLFIVWRIYRAGSTAEKLKSEKATRKVEQKQTDIMNKRVDPGETERKLKRGKF